VKSPNFTINLLQKSRKGNFIWYRTHTEEFYEVYECSWNVTELNPELIPWEYIYDCVRPHQALNYKTPLQFLRDSDTVA